MSATPSDDLIEEYTHQKSNCLISLYVRHHMDPIPVPTIRIIPKLMLKIFYCVLKLRSYQKENKPALIFAPTIELSKKVYNILKNFVKNGYFVNSTSNKRSEIIDKFRTGEYVYLVTTAVLERGVTLKNLQVIIFSADNKIYVLG